MAKINIIQAMQDKDLCGPLFKNLSTWKNWITCLKAIFALPMTDEEVKTYKKFTNRKALPAKVFRQVFLIIGRRGGKSFISAFIAVFLALFKDWSKYLRVGELGWIFVIASDRDQARIVHNHIKYILQKHFKDTVEKDLQNQIFLKNNIAIEVRTASWRGVRGYTVLAAICDELGFWRSEESANPGRDILKALRPGMSTVHESLLLGISTPHTKAGVLWEAYNNYYGKDDEYSLVWKAPTIDMNPTINAKDIERDIEEDPSFARAEWFAEFRADIESPFDPENLEFLIVKNRKLLLPQDGILYKAFVDPSGGKADSFTLGIAHAQANLIVLDRLEETKAPYDPKTAVATLSDIIKEYNCYQVVGDKFSGNWCANEFRDNGIRYIATEKSKSELYLIFQTLIMSKMVELLDLGRMKTQLQNLERRTHVGARDTIDHPRGLHDDVANSAAGAAVIVYKDMRLRLTPEYAAQRLPFVAGKNYSRPNSDYEQQRYRVLQAVRKREEEKKGVGINR